MMDKQTTQQCCLIIELPSRISTLIAITHVPQDHKLCVSVAPEHVNCRSVLRFEEHGMPSDEYLTVVFINENI
jgi:hypothetical protein